MFSKRSYKLYAVLACLCMSYTACQEAEEFPLEVRTEELIYDQMDINGQLAEQALTNLYTFLPKGFNRINGAFLDAATDDAVSSQLSGDIHILAKGYQNQFEVVDEVFAHNYTGISRANLFLSKIDVVPVSETFKQYWKAEARFLRAMFYFELIKRYGGVPLVGEDIFEMEDKISLPRNSFAECAQYITAECDAVSGLLRKDAALVPANELGRITQGAALALKARTLLYAASPLNNSANDAGRWQEAADAAKAIIDLNYFNLNSSFSGIFTTRNVKEAILSVQSAKSSSLEQANSPVGYYSDLYKSNGTTSPTQNLVEAFPMLNGRGIHENGSGYDEQDPYTGRDPRLEATVFYNGQEWLGRPVETFDGGKDRPGTALIQTKTGYYLRKFLPDLSSASNYPAADHNFIIFRYAEVLLNYAEAINEAADAVANRDIAYAQLKAIRGRAKITAGDGSLYGLKGNMTQDEMREAIRLERRLELAFEEHRFWDVRRWMTAETEFNKMLRGIRITKTADGSFSYHVEAVESLVFQAPQMYRYPIPFAELQANKALIQNPGW
ncbi:RagB/SusD family nutrient uptake outer membrane protein [Desertivirga xinjiangensis]|uniref:RagB/SusD family nutrient uptake outer membrane protein n=1 Tax=Desertivirga xinjiangensis TaxID=539206 RepID=UPI00210B3F2B|nr:RagB/SusD family nutrient uptake outer membrane protein [Pedobacter xinjiangensis]